MKKEFVFGYTDALSAQKLQKYNGDSLMHKHFISYRDKHAKLACVIHIRA